MPAFLLLYFRLALARLGFRRIFETIKDERAVQAWRRGDSSLLTERRIDISRHLAERRSLAFVLSAYLFFIAAMVSGGMHWSRTFTAVSVILAVGLFVAAVAQSPSDNTKAQTAQIGRNAPCPCGSGKKYKHCHGAA